MNKNELSAEIARRSGISRKDAETAVVTMTEVICDELHRGGKVQIVGFGVFEPKQRPARKARNPKTGEPIQLYERRSAIFKPGKGLKEAMLE